MTEINQYKLPWWGVLLVIVGAIPLFFLFYYFGKSSLAMPTMSSAAMLVVAIVVQWKLRGNVWFWVVIAVIIALHVPLILLVPWTSKWVPAIVIMPFAAADLWVMLWGIRLVEKLFGSGATDEAVG